MVRHGWRIVISEKERQAMSTETIVTFNGTSYDYSGMFNMSTPELIKVRNAAATKLGEKTIRSYHDKLSAVKGTWALLSKLNEAPASRSEATIATAPSEQAKVGVDQIAGHVDGQSQAEKAKRTEGTAMTKLVKAQTAKAAKAPKAPKEAKPRKLRGFRFVWKPKAKDEQTVPREGTFRSTLIKLLSRENGATFAECMAATWGTKKDMEPEIQVKTTYEAMRLLHTYCGYGMRHLDDSAKPRIQLYS
jgi:hypothetical protein